MRRFQSPHALLPVLAAALCAGCLSSQHPQAASAPTDDTTDDPTPHANHDPVSNPGPSVAPAACQDHAVVMLREQHLVRVTADGTQQVLFTFGADAGLDASGVVVNGWQVRNGFVGGYAFLYNPPQPHQYEYVVVRLDGQVVFHHTRQEPHNPSTFLGADGSLAISSDHGSVAQADGTVTQLGEFRPITALMDGQNLLVARGDPWRDESAVGWLHVPSLTFTAAPDTNFQRRWLPVGQRVVYLAGNAAEGIRLVDTSPSRTQMIPLPADSSNATYAVEATANRFVLLADGNSRRVLRVDLDNASASVVQQTAATQQSWDNWSATLLANGDVVRAFDNVNGEMQLRRTADLGVSWQDVGLPMISEDRFGLRSRLQTLAAGDSLLILNLSRGYGDFLDGAQLVTPHGITHVNAGGLYVNTAMHPGAADLSADGACAVVWVQSSGSVFEEGSAFDMLMLDGTQPEVSEVVLTRDYPAWMQFAQR